MNKARGCNEIYVVDCWHPTQKVGSGRHHIKGGKNRERKIISVNWQHIITNTRNDTTRFKPILPDQVNISHRNLSSGGR